MPITHAAHADPITATDYEADHEGVDDTIPSGGTLYDGASTSGWTSFGSPDTFDADTTVPNGLYIAKSSIGNNLVGAYRACGSFPKTYTMRMKGSLGHANYHSAGIFVGEASAAGKMFTWGAVHDGAGSYPQRYSWTTITSASANTNYNAAVHYLATGRQWWRIVVNSTTDIEYHHSYDGHIWYPFAVAINPSATLAIFGFAMSAFGSIPMAMAVEWIHES